MQGGPDATKPPKSAVTKVVLAVGLAVCVAACAGIAVLGVDVATSEGDATPEDGGTADPADRSGGPHAMIDDVCAPLTTIETSPNLSEIRPGTSKEDRYLAHGACTAASVDAKSRADVNIAVFYDAEYAKAVDVARDAYEGEVRLHRDKSEGVEALTGLGDRAFAVTLAPEDSTWTIHVVSANLNVRIDVLTGLGKQADLEQGRLIAQTYLDATRKAR